MFTLFCKLHFFKVMLNITLFFKKTSLLLPFLPVKNKKSIVRKIEGQGGYENLNVVNIISAYNEETLNDLGDQS